MAEDRWLGNLDGTATAPVAATCRASYRVEGPARSPSRHRARELRPARSGDRPHDPGRLCAGAVHPQGRRDLLLGRPVAPVSRVTLDAAVRARRLFGYKALMGAVLSRKTGACALKRPVPVVLGLRPDGKIVDYRLARTPRRRSASTAARACWRPPPATASRSSAAGRTRYVLDKVRNRTPSGRISTLPPQPHQGPERRQALTLGRCIPQGSRLPRDDLDDLLTCFQDPDQRRQVSTLSSDGRSGHWALSRPRWTAS